MAASLHVTDFLNRARWTVDDAVRVFAAFAPILAEFEDNPLIVAGLADPETFGVPHDDIDGALTVSALGALGAIFQGLTTEQKAALYAFRATRNVPGR